MKNNKPNLYLIDLFCGAGGVTTGFDKARFRKKQFCEVIACINHDAKAIDSHYANHPFVQHYTEDIRQLDLADLVSRVKQIRTADPHAVIVLWASLECTNFSKAKGGKTRKADSRMLGDEMYRYIMAINPDYFMVENVIEFVDWGPLRIAAIEHETYSELLMEDEEYLMTPDKNKLKEFFIRWRDRIKSYGYQFEDNNEGTLNAADYGACQSRKRYFAIFAKHGLPIAWPQQTHTKNPKKNPGFKKHRAVRGALDLKNHGESIFHRKKPITSEKSWSRVYEGLVKHVAGGKEKFMLKYNSVNGKTGKHVVPGIDEPCSTINTQGRLGIVSADFLLNYNHSSNSNDINKAAPTIVSADKFGKAHCDFLQQYNGGNRNKNRTLSLDNPIRTIDTQNRYAITQPMFLVHYRGASNSSSLENAAPTVTAGTGEKLYVTHCQFLNKNFSGNPQYKNQSIEEPSGAITTVDHHALVSAHYLVNYHGKYKDDRSIDRVGGTVTSKDDCGLVSAQFLKIDHSEGQQHRDLNQPSGAIKTVTKENLVTCIPFVVNTINNSTPKNIDEPVGTITASRRHQHYLVNPQWNASQNSRSIDEPSNTVIARLDKAPSYLVTTIEGFLAIEIYETDTPMMRKIKEFMALYGIVDIKMRMLTIIELLRIQGFSPNYILVGTQGDKKKFIGNAVEVNQAKVIAEALYAALYNYFELKMAA